MSNSNKPPLPPNRPYCWPLNNLKYVKDFNPDVHVKNNLVAIKANNEIDTVKIINLFGFTLRDILSD